MVKNGNGLITDISGADEALMWIARRIKDNEKFETNKYRELIFDPLGNFRYNYDKCPYIELDSHIPLSLELIVDMSNLSVSEQRLKFTKTIQCEYMQALTRKNYIGEIPYVTFFIVDSLNRFFNGVNEQSVENIVADAKNVGITFIASSRKPSEIMFADWCGTYLFGLAGNEKDLNVIQKLTNRKVRDKVASLKPRWYVFYDKANDVGRQFRFPNWVKIGETYELVEDISNGFVVEF